MRFNDPDEVVKLKRAKWHPDHSLTEEAIQATISKLAVRYGKRKAFAYDGQAENLLDDDVEYQVQFSQCGLTTVCTLIVPTFTFGKKSRIFEFCVGTATLGTGDQFNQHRGETIALARAVRRFVRGKSDNVWLKMDLADEPKPEVKKEAEVTRFEKDSKGNLTGRIVVRHLPEGDDEYFDVRSQPEKTGIIAAKTFASASKKTKRVSKHKKFVTRAKKTLRKVVSRKKKTSKK